MNCWYMDTYMRLGESSCGFCKEKLCVKTTDLLWKIQQDFEYKVGLILIVGFSEVTWQGPSKQVLEETTESTNELVAG